MPRYSPRREESGSRRAARQISQVYTLDLAMLTDIMARTKVGETNGPSYGACPLPPSHPAITIKGKKIFMSMAG